VDTAVVIRRVVVLAVRAVVLAVTVGRAVEQRQVRKAMRVEHHQQFTVVVAVVQAL